MDSSMSQRPVHYGSDMMRVRPTSPRADQANSRVLVAGLDEQLAQYQEILRVQREEISMHENKIRQLKASVAKNEASKAAVENSIQLLKNERQTARHRKEVLAVQQNAAFTHRPSMLAGPMRSAIWLELQTIRAVCANFVENMEEIYTLHPEMSSFMSRQADSYDIANLPNQTEARIYDMIRSLKVFNEFMYTDVGIWGDEDSRQGIQNRWCNAANSLSNGTLILTCDDGSEHLVNFIVHVSDDWGDDDPRYLDLIPEPVTIEDGVRVLDFNGLGSHDIARVYMRTLASSASHMPLMHATGPHDNVFIAPAVGHSKRIQVFMPGQLSSCQLQIGNPLQTIVRLNVSTDESLLRK